MLNPCYVHGTTHVHGYVHACSCMFVHVKFWLPVWPSPPSHLEYFRATDHDILPTFVDGYAFGQAIGVGLQAISDWWTVSRVEMDPTLGLSEGTSLSVITLIFVHNSNLSPSHTVY